MSRNKIVIDLRRILLTNEQRKDLHNALHKAVTSQLKKIDNSKSEMKSQKATFGVANNETMTANLSVSFTNVNPGDSELKAILHGQEQTIDHSGTITFANVKGGDTILIQVESLGTTTVTIDISADPTQMNFPPGHHDDEFFINYTR